MVETKSDSICQSVITSEKNISKTDEKKQIFNHVANNFNENTNKDNLSLSIYDPCSFKVKKKKGVKLRYLIDESTTIDMLHHKSSIVYFFINLF